MIDVELQRISAGLLHQLRIIDPSSRRAAIERSDHRHRHGVLDFAQLLQISVAVEGKFVTLGKIRQGFGVRIGKNAHLVDRPQVLADNLLLKERVHHNGRCTGILQTADHVQVVHER